MIKRIAICLTILAAPVAADETWNSDMGRIVYETEENGAAIFSFMNVDAYPAIVVIPGLAGNYSNRSVHNAYWVGQGAGYCPAFLAAPGGEPSSNWGQAVISFDGPAFPTSFTLTLGDCFGPLTYAIRAETP